jgi:hypothetical protein
MKTLDNAYNMSVPNSFAEIYNDLEQGRCPGGPGHIRDRLDLDGKKSGCPGCHLNVMMEVRAQALREAYDICQRVMNKQLYPHDHTSVRINPGYALAASDCAIAINALLAPQGTKAQEKSPHEGKKRTMDLDYP